MRKAKYLVIESSGGSGSEGKSDASVSNTIGGVAISSRDTSGDGTDAKVSTRLARGDVDGVIGTQRTSGESEGCTDRHGNFSTCR